MKVSGGGSVEDLSEDDLDIDVVSAIAPGAQIVNYEAPSTASGVVDLFNRVVSDGRVGIASFSWGACDVGLPSSYRTAVTSALKLAALRGITVFVASGDSGSYDCQRSDFADHRLSVDFPASSPQAVAVGGTLLSVNTDGSYAGEAGWEAPLSNAGGGGGVNRLDAAPSWQTAAGVAGGHRGVPDVSASASPDSGWVTRDYGNWDTAGGTSAATPFWAASMLLAEQYAKKQGIKRRCFLAPILYRLAATHGSRLPRRPHRRQPLLRRRPGLGLRDGTRLTRRLEPRPCADGLPPRPSPPACKLDRPDHPDDQRRDHCDHDADQQEPEVGTNEGDPRGAFAPPRPDGTDRLTGARAEAGLLEREPAPPQGGAQASQAGDELLGKQPAPDDDDLVGRKALERVGHRLHGVGAPRLASHGRRPGEEPFRLEHPRLGLAVRPGLVGREPLQRPTLAGATT